MYTSFHTYAILKPEMGTFCDSNLIIFDQRCGLTSEFEVFLCIQYSYDSSEDFRLSSTNNNLLFHNRKKKIHKNVGVTGLRLG